MSYVRLADLENAPGARLIGGGAGISEERPLPLRALAIPQVRQLTEYSCGPAALLAIMRYWGIPVGSERDLYNSLGTTKAGGTRPRAIVNTARKFGLSADERRHVAVGELQLAIAQGETVILNLQRWEADAPERGQECEDGHFAVLLWIDDQDAYLMDPYTGGFAWLPINALLDRWYDRPWPGEPCEQRVAVVLSGEWPRPAPRAADVLAARYR